MYRLITRHTIEEKILGLQKFKLKTANTVISSDNSSLQSMATEQIFDLFSLEEDGGGGQGGSGGAGDENGGAQGTSGSIKAILENMPELWDDRQYEEEYDIKNYMNRNK